MTKYDVRTPDQALAYMIDCTLATVYDMAMKKSRGKYEYQRQIGIAQIGIDWAVFMGIDLSETRGAEVIRAGNVKYWADKYDVLLDGKK